MDTTERSRQFLAIYKQVDDFLRKQLGTGNLSDEGRPLPFYGVIDTLVAKGNVPVMVHAPALRRYGSLRNAIVHWGPQPYAIAEPHEDTIKTFERIRRDLMAPPRLLEIFKHRVESVLEGDALISVMRTMKEKSYSQLPVYRGNTLLGLLTADAIVGWLAESKSEAEAMSRPVGPILGEGQENFAILRDTASVFDALNAFDTRRSILAILVTDSGARDGRPITILTAWDYPKLAAKVGHS
jgi:predicted transcriptional regulator